MAESITRFVNSSDPFCGRLYLAETKTEDNWVYVESLPFVFWH